jgi:hypothetical protein
VTPGGAPGRAPRLSPAGRSAHSRERRPRTCRGAGFASKRAGPRGVGSRCLHTCGERNEANGRASASTARFSPGRDISTGPTGQMGDVRRSPRMKSRPRSGRWPTRRRTGWSSGGRTIWRIFEKAMTGRCGSFSPPEPSPQGPRIGDPAVAAPLAAGLGRAGSARRAEGYPLRLGGRLPGAVPRFVEAEQCCDVLWPTEPLRPSGRSRSALPGIVGVCVPRRLGTLVA